MAQDGSTAQGKKRTRRATTAVDDEQNAALVVVAHLAGLSLSQLLHFMSVREAVELLTEIRSNLPPAVTARFEEMRRLSAA